MSRVFNNNLLNRGCRGQYSFLEIKELCKPSYRGVLYYTIAVMFTYKIFNTVNKLLYYYIYRQTV